jgi:hypothetical protein
MKERPILFSTAMVQAILAGRKTVTRRVVKVNIRQECEGNEPYCFSVFDKNWNQYCDSDEMPLTLADITNFHKYGKPGDALWVRETWAKYVTSDCAGGVTTRYRYKADLKDECYQWKPSIHMPRAACRLRLKIVSIRVERLHDITEEDAVREGINPVRSFDSGAGISRRQLYENYLPHGYTEVLPIDSFKSLWISINGHESWDQNPWVWRIEFEKIQ